MSEIMPQVPPSQPNPAFVPMPTAYASPMTEPYALYSPQAVGLATFLGSPIAGTALIAMNYRRLGRSAAAIQAIVWGLVSTAVLIGLGFLIPVPSLSMAIGVVVALLMKKIAEMLQADTFELHKVAGGKVASMWKATGVGLLSMIILLGLIFAAVMATQPAGRTRLAVGNGDILYSSSFTKADATALGKALTDNGYFSGSTAATVLLDKDASGKAIIQFVVNEEAAKKDSTLETYSQITDRIAPSVGGKPITLKLLSPTLAELKSKKVE